ASAVKPEVIDFVALSALPGSEDAAGEPHSHGHAHHDSEDNPDHDHAGHGEDESAEADGHAGHEHGEFNEHPWYSVPTMTKLVDDAALHLGEALPDQAETITANAEEYTDRLGELESTIAAVKDEHGGEKVAATEPV
ncbi:ABC transporter substrate-binding protein, partial [Burkholderia multivorans]